MLRKTLTASLFVLTAAAAGAQDRTPLDAFVDGFPIELEKETREADYNELFRGGDPSAYFNVRTSEFFPTAILPSRQGVMPLASNPMPEIGEIKSELPSESKLDGPLTLNETHGEPGDRPVDQRGEDR